MHAVVFSAEHRYADPWHPFTETSEALASIAREAGFSAEVRSDVPEALSELADVDVLVINSGGALPGPIEPTDDWSRAHASLAAWIAGGGPVLATHTAANTFPDWDEWPTILGGRWVRGTSGHPQRSMCCFQAFPDQADHPVFAGLEPLHGAPGADEAPCVVTFDERYCDLAVHEDATPLMRHELGDGWQTTSWLRDRVLYDAMGHDARAYASATRRRLVANQLTWLARP